MRRSAFEDTGEGRSQVVEEEDGVEGVLEVGAELELDADVVDVAVDSTRVVEDAEDFPEELLPLEPEPLGLE